MKSFLDRLDRVQQRRAWAAFPFAVLKKFGEDQAGNLAALIAYYAIFSIFPLMLALTTVMSFVLHGHPGLQHGVTQSALRNLPLINLPASPPSGSIIALVVGLALSLWSGLGVAKAAQTAFNTVYLVSHTDRPNFLKSTLRALGLVVVGGGGLIVTTIIASAVTSVHSLGGVHLGIGVRIAGTALAVVLNTALFMLLFRWLTVRHVRWRDAMPGALMSAVALQILQLAASAFISHKLSGASKTYGKDVAGVIVLLSWFYLQAQVVLLAAEVNVVRQYKLWPRAMTDAPATEADFRTYEAYAERERYQDEEDVDTSFDGPEDKTTQDAYPEADQSGFEQKRGRRIRSR
ncbi:MAG TPA: YihY/virulence factor BrkB family protein [Mycobacteriales bacterium]|nr:YihY/virulence factor BrkB family protein [Mycobacteriales bacterium]